MVSFLFLLINFLLCLLSLSIFRSLTLFLSSLSSNLCFLCLISFHAFVSLILKMFYMPVNFIVQVTTYSFLITSVANTFCKAPLFQLVLHWLELLLLWVLRLLLNDLVLGPWHNLLRLITFFLCHFNYISFITERLTKYYFTCRLLRDALRVSQFWRHHFWDLCIFWIQPELQRYLSCSESCGYVPVRSSSRISPTSCGALYALT